MLPIDRERVAGLVLAAGASRRMGCNKMLLQIDGETLIHRAARRANEAGLDPVVVVVGRDVDAETAAVADLDCTVVTNPDGASSTSTSMHLAIDAVPADVGAVVIILADMIHVTADMLRQVREVARAPEVAAVAARYGGVTAPPLLFTRQLFSDLRACHGEGAGKRVIDCHADRARWVELPPDALQDVDTPDDWPSGMAGPDLSSARVRLDAPG